MRYRVPFIGGPNDGKYYESDTLPPAIFKVVVPGIKSASDYIAGNPLAGITDITKIRTYTIRKYESPTGQMYYDNLTGKRKEYVVSFEVYVIMDDPQ